MHLYNPNLYDLPTSLGNHLFLRDIWETVYHRLGVLVLRMLLEAERVTFRDTVTVPGEKRIQRTLVLW